MRRRRLALVTLLALASLALLHACTDRDRSGSPLEPDARLGVPGHAAPEARINAALKDLFPPPSLRRDANKFFSDLKKAVAQGEDADARALVFGFLARALDELEEGDLSDPPGATTTAQRLAELTDLLFDFAGVEPPGIDPGVLDGSVDGAVAVVEPSPSDTTITTASEFAGTTIPGGAVEEPVVVAIQRREDVDVSDCLPLGPGVGQFEGCYQFDAIPDQDFESEVVVGVCLETGPSLDDVRLHKFRPEEPDLGVKPLPTAAAPFLDCSGFQPIAFRGGNPLTRLAARGVGALGRLLSPAPLGAAHTGSGGLAINFSDIGWAQDNGLAFDSDSANLEILRSDSDGGHVANLTGNLADDLNPKWSPDGTKIAFRSTRSGAPHVWIMDADGTNPVQVTDNSTSFNNPHSWSPTGDSLTASIISPSGNLGVYIMATDGSNRHLVIDTAGSGAWSPDGSRIAVEKTDPITGLNQIFTVDPDGSTRTRLTASGSNLRPAWSPDGSKIAFMSNRDGNPEVYVMDTDGSNQVNVTNDPGTDTEPAWSGDGGRIAFETNRDGDVEIYLMDPDGGDPTNVTNRPASDEGNPDWVR